MLAGIRIFAPVATVNRIVRDIDLRSGHDIHGDERCSCCGDTVAVFAYPAPHDADGWARLEEVRRELWRRRIPFNNLDVLGGPPSFDGAGASGSPPDPLDAALARWHGKGSDGIFGSADMDGGSIDNGFGATPLEDWYLTAAAAAAAAEAAERRARRLRFRTLARRVWDESDSTELQAWWLAALDTAELEESIYTQASQAYCYSTGETIELR